MYLLYIASDVGHVLPILPSTNVYQKYHIFTCSSVLPGSLCTLNLHFFQWNKPPLLCCSFAPGPSDKTSTNIQHVPFRETPSYMCQKPTHCTIDGSPIVALYCIRRAKISTLMIVEFSKRTVTNTGRSERYRFPPLRWSSTRQ